MAELHPTIKHVRYLNDEPICSDRQHIPEYPIRMDAYDGIACPRCTTRMNAWILWWKEQGIIVNIALNGEGTPLT